MLGVWATNPFMINSVIELMEIFGLWIQPRITADKAPSPNEGIAGTLKIAKMINKITGNMVHGEIQKLFCNWSSITLIVCKLAGFGCNPISVKNINEINQAGKSVQRRDLIWV